MKLIMIWHKQKRTYVAPLAGAWVEIARTPFFSSCMARVAPLAGAWVEIAMYADCMAFPLESLPSRGRGLKSQNLFYRMVMYCVAPLAGAWVEISPQSSFWPQSQVAPPAGAWVEIMYLSKPSAGNLSSLPRRERGLKYYTVVYDVDFSASLPWRERGLK